MEEPVQLPGSLAMMPRLGLGVYQLRGEECFVACLAGLEAGYRHVDTAQLYGNEEEVRRAVGVFLRRQRDSDVEISAGGVTREDLFLTTKVGRWEGGGESMYESVLGSVMRVAGEGEDGGYVDLILIHRPVARWRDLWSMLGRLVREGRARAIGVSNFGIAALEEMKGCEGGLPCVNQIELHPWCQQRDLVAYCQLNGIFIQAYSPLARGRRWADPVLREVVERVTPAQVLIRWSLQHGFVPLPKSGGASRIKENEDVFWFRLDGVEMGMLDGLDLGAEGALFPKNVS
ncbi:NADP-dependent oxidoreductase domain-containing protein [Colletotrichum godetiae]|uniref:NADP-dependent oxidoreductase domain-containing protein n=1 Tax=Colletotrichum godetiae TaxID=1209918 RepID=A0AAJ0F346_9PEZI|nr:NADP-dependent oxidoreductase domain-containing protein [Colletotrichum godetiae]KAK1691183.1 NADP-dependent oxidoreductase domain-containing protein [Colletotrichum godetiae]